MLTPRTLVMLIALAMSAVALSVAVGWTILEQRQTTVALCRAAHRSADTKDAFVDVFERAYAGDMNAAPYLAELRAAVDSERDAVAADCPPPPTEEP